MPNDPRMRARVARWGRKVVCVLCKSGLDGTLRHRPETDGRLRRRSCPKCGAPPGALVTLTEVKRRPELVRSRRRELEGVTYALFD